MYISITDLESKLNKTLTDAQKTLLEDLIIPSVQKFIENYTHRTFEKSEADVEKWYFGNDLDTLEIDDFASITNIKGYDEDDVLQETFTATDYELTPFNESYVNEVRLKDDAFDEHKYKVTGKTGWTSIPEDIKNVCLELTSQLIMNSGGVKSETIEGYSYTLSDIVEESDVIRESLNSRRRIQI